MDKTRILIIRYSNTISHSDISYFRGAVIKNVEEDGGVLFHNHQEDGFRYSYPLIQYKRINQKAAIVCLNEGIESMSTFLAKSVKTFMIGSRTEEYAIESINANQFLIQEWNSEFYYRLRKWMPLNQENYIEYQKLEGIVEKTSMLEKVLFGNLLSFTEGIGITIDRKNLQISILEIDAPKLMMYKGVKMMNFDIVFKSNLSIPDYIGIGKGGSIGHGIITKKQ